MDKFVNFFKSGQVGNTNLTDLFTKDGFSKIKIPPPKPLPPPAPIRIDPNVKEFFENDVKKFVVKDVLPIVKDLGHTAIDAAKDLMKAPTKVADAGVGIVSSPFFLPVVLVGGGLVLMMVLKNNPSSMGRRFL